MHTVGSFAGSSRINPSMKRVLLFVVDGCTSRVLRPLVDDGALPTFAALRDRGTLAYDCLSIFPSITPAATASIVTGRYPQDHGIAGMSWWDPATDRVSYYGDDVWTVLQRGLGTFMRDFLLRLNGDRLRAPTIFETAERQGRRAGCINHLIFRGDVAHEVRIPTLLSLWPGVPSGLTVRGPSLLCLGDLVSNYPQPEDLSLEEGGPFNRYGFDDQGTEDFLLDLEGAGELPDVTVAYLADYDFDSHGRGPHGAADTLRMVDGRLASVFEAWGGVDRVLEDACILLTADHAHSDVRPGDPGRLVLPDLLAGYRTAGPGAPWDHEDIMACPNMRVAEIYFRRGGRVTVQDVSATLLEDARVDQVIWREHDGPGGEYCVATRDRGRLRFSPAEGTGDAVDAYGAGWHLHGDLSAVDAQTTRSGGLHYGRYPNGLERIGAALASQPVGRVLVTATPGCEFAMPGQSVHGGAGSHGTLHELDSLVPLLMAGVPAGVRLPEAPRIVDVEPLCRQMLALDGGLPPGASHMKRAPPGR